VSSAERVIRVGADIGGTFTDLVLQTSNGHLYTKKLLSTPDDYGRAISEGLEALFAELGLSGGSVSEVLHGTTVATNAILERRGARTGLVTTRGFRDVLELGRMRRPTLYDVFWEKPEPLVERGLRLEVAERVDAVGKEVVPVRSDDVRAAARRFVAAGIESIAVSFLHAYHNPTHEQEVGKLLADILPAVSISLSSDVLPEINEYERTSTTVINAYVRPIVQAYLEGLIARLSDIGVKAPVLVMQSSGGMMTARTAAQYPIHIVESGPAAGVIGAAYLSKTAQLGDVITFDMGGTTAKASIVERGRPNLASEYEVGAGISIGARLQSGGGYLLRVPAVDLAEVGAGGGSVVWIDKGGALQVGPQSAGASPGPVCYGLGGSAATITDANVVLGYINPTVIAGGAVKIDVRSAARVLEAQVASPLGMSLLEACHGVYQVANARMTRAIKAVTTERGRDPRQFTLIAFGGSGPIHAAEMARSLKIPRVIVPPSPGLFSAYGLLMAEVEWRAVRTYHAGLDKSSASTIENMYRELEVGAGAQLERDGYTLSKVTRFADLRYFGQSYELLIEISDRVTPDSVLEIAGQFGTEHERTYGYRGDDSQVEIINLRVSAKATLSRLEGPISRGNSGRTTRPPETLRARKAFFGAAGMVETPTSDRNGIGSSWRPGPLIIEEYDSTVVVPPGFVVRLDERDNIVMAEG
jgi:N-methylhydantoinase A